MKRILSIDGGGIRGIIPAALLAGLEQRTGRPAGEMFDLLTGSSTGGILAIAAGLLRIPAIEMERLYGDRGPEIFRRRWYRPGVFRPRYDGFALERILEQTFAGAAFRDSRRRVMVTAVRIQDRRTALQKSWEPSTITAVEAALRTSAAPTYFAPRPGGEVDGGVAVNNPSVCALAEATRLFGAGEEIRLLSLGCGAGVHSVDVAPSRPPLGWGLAGWAPRIASDLIDCAMEAADYQCRQLIAPGGYLRLQPLLGWDSQMDDASPENIGKLRDVARNQVETRLDSVIEFLCA